MYRAGLIQRHKTMQALLAVLVLVLGATSCSVFLETDDEAATPTPEASSTPIDGPSEVPTQTALERGLEAAEAAREAGEAWSGRGVSTYSYLAQVAVTDDRDGRSPNPSVCGALGGQISVRVSGGSAFEATDVENDCLIDLLEPDRIPLSFGEWFAALFDIAAADQQLTLGALGEPTRFSASADDRTLEFELLEFAPGVAPEEPDVPRLDALELANARQTWTGLGIENYEITVARVCRCTPAFRGPFDISVVDGAAESITIDGEPADPEIEASSLTVDGLFATLADLADSDGLNVEFDPTRGIPITIVADPNAGTADDEFELRVIGFVDRDRPQSEQPVAEALISIDASFDTAPFGLDAADRLFCGVDLVPATGPVTPTDSAADTSTSEPAAGESSAEESSAEVTNTDTEPPARRPDVSDPIARACIIDAANRRVDALLIQHRTTPEGRPTVELVTTSTDGTVTIYREEPEVDRVEGGAEERRWIVYDCVGIAEQPARGLNFFEPICGG